MTSSRVSTPENFVLRSKSHDIFSGWLSLEKEIHALNKTFCTQTNCEFGGFLNVMEKISNMLRAGEENRSLSNRRREERQMLLSRLSTWEILAMVTHDQLFSDI